MESPLLIHQNVPNLRKWPEEIQVSLILTFELFRCRCS
jgi:hypothetical protein